tara:strand:- start:17 stop:334 length:318 start_codon:yes stop_codon:yes gene_type:complete
MKVDYMKIFGLIALGFGIYFLNFFLSLVFMKWFWPKIANILFPKLVESGQVVTMLTFHDAFWLALYIGLILTALFGRFAKIDKNTKQRMKDNIVKKEDVSNKEDK